MNGLLYVLIFALLFFAELFYFHIADKFRWWHYLFTGFMDMGFLFWIFYAVVSYGRYLNWGRKFYR